MNEWDCWPVSKRIIDPNKACRFVECLHRIQQDKVDTAIFTATTVSEIKKAFQAKAMLSRYGTSGYLHLLDNELAPLQSREERLKKETVMRCREKARVLGTT